MWFKYIAMCPKETQDGMANGVEPDQTAPGSTQFAKTHHGNFSV